MRKLNKKIENQKESLEAYFFCCYCHCTCDCSGSVAEYVKYTTSNSLRDSSYNNPSDFALWW